MEANEGDHRSRSEDLAELKSRLVHRGQATLTVFKVTLVAVYFIAPLAIGSFRLSIIHQVKPYHVFNSFERMVDLFSKTTLEKSEQNSSTDQGHLHFRPKLLFMSTHTILKCI